MPNEFVARNGIIALDSSRITGSLGVSGGITGSLLGTASFATTASFVSTATTASYVTGSIFTNANSAATASFAQTSSYVNPLRQTVIVSGALNLVPSIDPDPTGVNIEDTYLFVSRSNTALGNDLYFRQDGNVTKFKWIEGGSLNTGILFGGAWKTTTPYIKISGVWK